MLLCCETERLDFAEGEPTQTLRLQSDARSTAGAVVAYKVRTTAPQRFAVVPVIGLIKPGEHIDVRGTCTIDSVVLRRQAMSNHECVDNSDTEE